MNHSFNYVAMERIARWVTVLCTLLASVPLPVAAQAASGQTVRSVAITVEETVGIRRNFYPVNVRVPFPPGVLDQFGQTRLVAVEDGAEVVAQSTVISYWPDGSIQWLQVDSNISMGPEETRSLRLEYGPVVALGENGSRGLTLIEEIGAVQVGRVRFGKNGFPLVRSVAYRQELIAPGSNGFVVTDTSGIAYELGGADVSFEVVRRGPVYVELSYSGRVMLPDGVPLPFALTIEMPNSKSWVKATAVVEDQNNRLRGLEFHSPLALGPHPWVWDFGTDRWTYGVLRNEDGSVTLQNDITVKGEAKWWVNTGSVGQERSYETSGSTTPVLPGWGHLQGNAEVVAFAVDRFATIAGSHRIAINGSGLVSFQVEPAEPASRHKLTVYQHFVSNPVQIGAATSPPSMLQPLVVRVDPQQYAASGVTESLDR